MCFSFALDFFISCCLCWFHSYNILLARTLVAYLTTGDTQLNNVGFTLFYVWNELVHNLLCQQAYNLLLFWIYDDTKYSVESLTCTNSAFRMFRIEMWRQSDWLKRRKVIAYKVFHENRWILRPRFVRDSAIIWSIVILLFYVYIIDRRTTVRVLQSVFNRSCTLVYEKPLSCHLRFRKECSVKLFSFTYFDQ